MAWCEIGELKYGDDLHKDLKVTGRNLVATWNGVVHDLPPLMDFLGEHNVTSYSYPSSLYLDTYSPSQLGYVTLHWQYCRYTAYWALHNV